MLARLTDRSRAPRRRKTTLRSTAVRLARASTAPTSSGETSTRRRAASEPAGARERLVFRCEERESEEGARRQGWQQKGRQRLGQRQLVPARRPGCATSGSCLHTHEGLELVALKAACLLMTQRSIEQPAIGTDRGEVTSMRIRTAGARAAASMSWRGPSISADGRISPKISTKKTDTTIATSAGTSLSRKIGNASLAAALQMRRATSR